MYIRTTHAQICVQTDYLIIYSKTGVYGIFLVLRLFYKCPNLSLEAKKEKKYQNVLSEKCHFNSRRYWNILQRYIKYICLFKFQKIDKKIPHVRTCIYIYKHVKISTHYFQYYNTLSLLKVHKIHTIYFIQWQF